MPSRTRAEQPRRSETSTPSEVTEPYQHPADHSWNLQILLDLKGAIERLEERTTHASKEVDILRQDFKGVPTRAAFWSGIGLVVVVLLGLGAAYWIAFDARISAITSQIQTVSTSVQQLQPKH